MLAILRADLKKKNELPYIILKPNKLRISGEEFKILSYHEYCKLLITCSCWKTPFFQYKVQVFFNEIVADGSLGKNKYDI